jgi:hypothetical protein
MTASTDFVPFATAAGANVQDQADYAAAGYTATGFQSGIAQSAPVNKALRQSTFTAAAFWNFIIGLSATSQPDDGNIINAVANIDAAFDALIAQQNGHFYTYAGNPNGFVAGIAGVAGVSPPDLCEDTTTGHLWVCTTTGNAAAAVWSLGAAAGVTSITAGAGLSGGTITSTGTIALGTATTSVLGGVKVDGTSITISGGVISSTNAGGNMVGPSPTVVGDFVAWNNTSGTLTKDVAAATASQIWVGTDNGSPVTSLSLKSAMVNQTLTDASSTSWAMASGQNAKWTLGGNRTLAAPTGALEGATYSLKVYQPSSGGPCTVTWPTSFDWLGAGVPTLSTTASVRDVVYLECETTSPLKFIATFAKGS